MKDYLLNLFGIVEVADLMTSHVRQLTTLLSEPACRLIKPIEIDYNFIEVEDQYLFDIADKRFIKESGSLKGSLRTFSYSNFKISSQVPKSLSHLIMLCQSLSHLITPYPLGWKKTIFNWQL